MDNAILGLGFWLFLGLLAAWSLFWKGWGLWRSARLGQKKWFVAILILNTVGILEILYIYVFSRKHSKRSQTGPRIAS
jgi:hypothetical protein